VFFEVCFYAEYLWFLFCPHPIAFHVHGNA
jgi:hypothetical protein